MPYSGERQPGNHKGCPYTVNADIKTITVAGSSTIDAALVVS